MKAKNFAKEKLKHEAQWQIDKKKAYYRINDEWYVVARRTQGKLEKIDDAFNSYLNREIKPEDKTSKT